MCGWNRATPGRLPRAARAPPRPRFPSSPSVLPPGLHADPPPGVAPRAAGLGVTRRRLRHHNSNYRTRRLSAPAPRGNQNLHFESAGRVLSALLRSAGEDGSGTALSRSRALTDGWAAAGLRHGGAADPSGISPPSCCPKRRPGDAPSPKNRLFSNGPE